MKHLKMTLLLAIYVTFTTTLWAFDLEELSPADLSQLKDNELIIKTKEIPGKPWPEITIYTLINASALESFALFAAYDIQKNYVPNITKSEPVKHVSATDVHTAYELKIPFPLSNAHYVHGARLFKVKNDYKTQWYMVESSSSLEVDGDAYFKNYNEKQTILKYRSVVVPKSSLGKLVKNMMLKDVKASLLAIKNFIEKTTRDDRELTTKYTKFIERAFNGEFVYQDQIKK